MYVNISGYKIREKEENTFLEMIMFEEKMNAQPAGLSHYHILKDKKEPRKYWVVEFWFNETDKENYDKLDSHKYFLSLLDGVTEGDDQSLDCELIK
jgi:heme-degrading monooxygenase HmoA